MFSTDIIFRQKENLVDKQKSQAAFRPLYNKILILNQICTDTLLELPLQFQKDMRQHMRSCYQLQTSKVL